MEQTIKELTIKLNERDFTNLKACARYYFLSPEELINYMIGDLTCGQNTLGSDERMLMLEWYERAGVNFEKYDEIALEEQLEQMFIEYTKKLNDEFKISTLFTDEITSEEVIDEMQEEGDLFSIRHKCGWSEKKNKYRFNVVFEQAYNRVLTDVFENLYIQGLVHGQELTDYLNFTLNCSLLK